MNKLELQIDAALESYPQAPLPARFLQRTMQRIRPRFRLEFLDLALPDFITLFLTTLIGLGFWVVSSLNPLWLLEVQVRFRWYSQNLDVFLPEPPGLAAIVFLTACIFAALAFAFTLFKPLPTRR